MLLKLINLIYHEKKLTWEELELELPKIELQERCFLLRGTGYSVDANETGEWPDEGGERDQVQRVTTGIDPGDVILEDPGIEHQEDVPD